MKRRLLLIALTAAMLGGATEPVDAHHFFGTCSPRGTCSACKNCKYCRHCSKDGGTCSVCR
jgi:hypothetical protein